MCAEGDELVVGGPPLQMFTNGWANTTGISTTVAPAGAGRTHAGKMQLQTGALFTQFRVRVATAASATPSGSIQIGTEGGTPILTCDLLNWTSTGNLDYDVNVDCDSATDAVELKPGIYTWQFSFEEASVRVYGFNPSGLSFVQGQVQGNCATGGGANSCTGGETALDAAGNTPGSSAFPVFTAWN